MDQMLTRMNSGLGLLQYSAQPHTKRRIVLSIRVLLGIKHRPVIDIHTYLFVPWNGSSYCKDKIYHGLGSLAIMAQVQPRLVEYTRAIGECMLNGRKALNNVLVKSIVHLNDILNAQRYLRSRMRISSSVRHLSCIALRWSIPFPKATAIPIFKSGYKMH